ncbi:NAD-dependent protein deacetylase sirtuin-1 isoform X2 [Brachyhypopomus gauderio]|uniref:NAD-dependent protein deacetylase sirtuin-1 isoform X2 n=1 Tax=Brachyhypopomus gauderio TaxID=698409 RepID=UPI0040420581
MADGENKLVGTIAGCDGMEEPVVKKPRSSLHQSRGLDVIRGEQRTCKAESGETWAAAILTRAEGAETAVSQATALAQEENKVSGIWEPSEDAYRPEQTSVSGPETELSGLMDDGVHSNGFYSPDGNDDDDCSSHASSSDWTPQPQLGSYRFIQQHIMRETDPRTILRDLLPETALSPDLDDMTLWQIIINISEPPKRKKRKDINTLEDVVRLLNDGKKILVLTGAGVSVSCGIPDFRSRDGIYARLAIDFPDLPDPQAMFDIEYFRRDPRPFFKFAKEIYPGQFQPSLCHKFIAMLDKKEKLLRNYTQNIDTLEQVAGVQKIIQCHGSFATASCLLCKHKVDCEAIREDVFKQVVPHCPRCCDVPFAIMKPDIVFFGENLPELFHRAMKQDKNEVDLLIVIGSSLKVRPVALIPSSIPHEVPQVLINREPLPHLNFDVELLGDCDVIVNELCHQLGGDFEQFCYNSSPLSEITEKLPLSEKYTEVQSFEVKLPRDGEINLSPSAATEARSYVESGNLNTNLPSLLGERDIPPNVTPQKSPCPGSSDTCEKAAIEVDDASLNKQYQKGDIPDRLEPKTEEIKKHRNHNNEVWKKCWSSQINRNPISKRLGAHQYLFQAPNRYIFHGAEVYSCSDDETSSSCDSEGSCCSENGLEEEESDAEADCAPGQSLGYGENDVRRTICDNKCLSSDNMTDSLHTTTDI